MEIFSSYKSQKNQNKQIENKNKYIKKHVKSYEEIRTHVLETPESKERSVEQVIGNLAKKKVNINVF